MITHPWFQQVDWEGMLRREVPAPWVPPASAVGLQTLNFEGEEVMDQTMPYHNQEKWEALFQPFGPYRSKPWPDGSAASTRERRPGGSAEL